MSTWLPVPGYEGRYEVSNTGEVRSFWNGTVRILKQVARKGRYLSVNLSVKNVQRSFDVHVLVASAFLGPRPEGLQVRHLDGDARNNRVSNLAYGTYRENSLDKQRHGTDPQLRKTECPAGHPYDGANTYVYARGRGSERHCRRCNSASVVRSRRRKARAAT